MKAVGAALVFFAAFTCGLLAGKREQRRIDEAEAFLALFEYIKNQVGYFLTPTKLIYRGFENKVLSDVGFLDRLCSHENDEIYFDAWGDAFRACEGELHLSAEEKRTVLRFGECIGKSDEYMQLKSFDYYIGLLSSELEKARSETAKNKKVYRTVGFAIGAMAAILLI